MPAFRPQIALPFRHFRLHSSHVIVLGFACIGLAVGALAAEEAITLQKQVVAGHLADLWVAHTDAVDGEILAGLKLLSTSSLPTCSEDDLQLLRNVVFGSRYLRSASRTLNGQTLCDAIAGRYAQPVPIVSPDIVTDHGRTLRLNDVVTGTGAPRSVSFGQGNASVSVGSDAFSISSDRGLQYAAFIKQRGRVIQFMSSPDLDLSLAPSDLQSGKSFRSRGKHYEVRCSSSYTSCIVARLDRSVPDFSAPVFFGLILFGSICGLALGYCMVLVRSRSVSIGRLLKQALKRETLELVYQPIVNIPERRIVGAEALVRWKDGKGKDVSPDLFIAVAETEGFVSEITRFVLEKTLCEMSGHLHRTPSFVLTVNIAATDLADPDFPVFVAQTMARHRVKPHSVGFEITERSTADRQTIAAGIRALQANGHRVYIDDFGVEYSSLSYLSELPVDGIKLDRSFCQLVHEDGRAKHIANHIVALLQLLQLDLVVEGIEREDQFAYFAAFSFSMKGQGWLFSRALAAPALIEMCRTG